MSVVSSRQEDHLRPRPHRKNHNLKCLWHTRVCVLCVGFERKCFRPRRAPSRSPSSPPPPVASSYAHTAIAAYLKCYHRHRPVTMDHRRDVPGSSAAHRILRLKRGGGHEEAGRLSRWRRGCPWGHTRVRLSPRTGSRKDFLRGRVCAPTMRRVSRTPTRGAMSATIAFSKPGTSVSRLRKATMLFTWARSMRSAFVAWWGSSGSIPRMRLIRQIASVPPGVLDER